MQIEVWAPANLLLVGEYVVTEEGGLGIAAAVQPEVQVRLSSASEFLAEAHTVKPLFQWHAHEPPPLEARLTAACLESLKYPDFPPVHIIIDSSAFYTPSGMKRGLGSSAAVAAAVVTALLLYRVHTGPNHADTRLSLREGCFADLGPGQRRGQDMRRTILRHAVKAHRHAQGGGSAYDVTASLFGGLGLFHGGDLPHWEALPADALPPAVIRYGDAPVSSPAAVLGYKGLKAAEPEFVNQHMRQSNQETLELAAALRAQDQDTFAHGLRRMGQLGLELGERIGVSAEIRPARSGYGKAVGAGNEIAVLFPELSLPDSPSPAPNGTEPLTADLGQGQPLHIATQGVRWCIRE